MYHHRASSRRHVLKAIAAGSVSVTSPIVRSASDKFPSRSIRLVVPSSPGGSLDTLGRLLAAEIQKQQGISVIVDNKPGASGAIGVQNIVNSPADGYSILISVADAVTIFPMVSKSVSYRWDRDLTPLARIATGTSAYAIPANSSVKSVPEFVALSNRSDLNYGTQGAGTSGHLMMEAFRLATGARLTHVPYKGMAPAMTAAVSGEVSIVAASPTSLAPFLASGRLKGLAVASSQRSTLMPDTPTMAESGFPDLVLNTWFGILAPANLPSELRERLTEMIVNACKSPTMTEQVRKLGAEPAPIAGAAFAKAVAEDALFWRSIVERSNVRID